MHLCVSFCLQIFSLETMLSLILLLSLPALLLFFLQKHKTIKRPISPPGPKGLPVIGNLHQLDNSVLPQQLWHLSKIYGPLFSLRLGSRPAIVVSSPKLAKDVMKNYDLEFCGRPMLVGQKRLSYNGLEMIFSPYNDYYKEIRKIGTIHVFSMRRVSTFSSLRKSEIMKMINKISSQAASSKVTDLSHILVSLTSTIICRIAFGRSYEEEGTERSRFHGLLHEVQAMMATFFVYDYVPFMGWIDRLTGLRARLERTHKELDEFLQEVINEHFDVNRKKCNGEDITDVLLQLKKQRSFSFDLTHDHIKAVLMDILLGGTDTSAATTVWAMTLLMKHPKAMNKVQSEMRNLYPNKDFVDEDDIQNLPYLKAVIKETFRVLPTVPLLVPRETNKDCTLGGYEIPAKTMVYTNAWAIHRDPETWKDPEEFYPERFMDSKIDFKGQDFNLVPFGAGRRICPGLHMGNTSVELVLANLLYFFDWEMPVGMKVEDIDTEMLPGLTMHKKNHLCLVAKNYVV